ncbi:MAG: sulfite exporter TauE/SafE family protein [Bacillota bacterium]
MNYIYLILIGVFAGIVNTMAGGGSLLTLPMLTFLGLPSAVANGTNRLAILIASITSVKSFKDRGYFEWKLAVRFGIPAVIGAMLGSKIAVNLSNDVFDKVLAVVMFLMLGIIIFQPHRKLKFFKKKNLLLGSVLFFFVGIYGGVIQAGVGFLIIMSLTLVTNYKLVKINSTKMFIVLIYMIPSFIIFLINGKVNFIYGIILAIGNAIGAYIGSVSQIKKGEKIVKIILTGAILIMSLKLLGIINI